MIRWMLSAALATTAIAASAGAQDNRLVSRVFDPDQVIRLDGKLNVQTTISFDVDEHIENVAVGDSDNWQITPNRRADLLFVKPLADNVRTNMTVVTDKRTYFFDLVASPTAKPVYALRLTYRSPAPLAGLAVAPAPTATPAPVAVAAAVATSADPQPEAPGKLGREALADPAEPPVKRRKVVAKSAAPTPAPAPVSAAAPVPDRVPKPDAAPAAEAAAPSAFAAAFAAAAAPTAGPVSTWRQTGPEDVDALRIRDDGTATYLRLPRLAMVPPVYSRGSDDVLTRLKVTRKDGELVIPGVPQQLVVGDGRKRVYLVRDPLAPAGTP